MKKWFCSQCHQQGRKYFDLLVLNEGKDVWTVCKTCKMGFQMYALGSADMREVREIFAVRREEQLP